MRRTPSPNQQEIKEFPRVAIVVAARNESKNLPNLLNDLIHQNYAPDRLEIWIADDRSTDDTWQIIQQYQRKCEFLHGIRIRESNPLMTGKKNALTQCIRKTQSPIILQTDADCRVGPGWAESMAAAFTGETGLVVGYSGRTPAQNFMGRYEAFDYLALNAANLGVLLNGRAWSGSGTNLAFLRAAFTDIRGFDLVADRVGDDDIYLVQSIADLSKYSVAVNLEKPGRVFSSTDSTLSGFFQQRIRWASTARGTEKRAPLFWIFLVSAFLSNVALLIGWSVALYAWLIWIGAKFISDFAVTALAAKRFEQLRLLPIFPIWFIIQPLYIPVVAIFGLLGRFKWKTA